MLKQLLILSVLSFSAVSQAKVSVYKLIKRNASVQKIQTALERGANVNRKGFIKDTPLMLAIEKNRPEVARLLLNYGAYVNVKDMDGRTALMYAGLSPNAYFAKLLLEETGANIRARDNEKMTALMYAAKSDHVETAKVLIDAGADVNAKDKYGETPLMGASLFGQVKAVKLLLSEGAYVKARDRDGKSALDYAYAYHKPLFLINVNETDLRAVRRVLIDAGGANKESYVENYFHNLK